jgi:hypothetical protein
MLVRCSTSDQQSIPWVALAALVTAAGSASAPARHAVARNGLIAFGSNRTTQQVA